MIRSTTLVGIGACLSLAAALAIPAQANEPAVDSGSVSADSYNLPQLSSAENQLLNSGEPLRVRLDVETGKIIDVEVDETQSRGVTQNNCGSGKACWYGWLSPHAFYGFDGSGATGTWANRGDFSSRDYKAKPCWLSGGATVCSESYVQKNTTIVWGSEIVGKRVYLTS